MGNGNKDSDTIVHNLFNDTEIEPSKPVAKEQDAAAALSAAGSPDQEGDTATIVSIPTSETLSPEATINPVTPPVADTETKENTFDPSKVPPREQWAGILQTILPNTIDLKDGSAVHKALQELDLSKLQDGQRHLVQHLLNELKKKAQAMENKIQQPDSSPKEPIAIEPSVIQITNGVEDLAQSQTTKTEATKSEAETLADALEERYLIKGAEGADPKEIAV